MTDRMFTLSRLRPLALVLALMAVPSCMVAMPEPEPELPVTRWDHRPEAENWTRMALTAIDTHGTALPATLPADIQRFCPGYATASEDDRAAFWVGLFSALAEYESTWNPRAAGAGGLYRGLLQISPRTAEWVGCRARGDDLYDGGANLSCAVRIAARQVERTGVIVGENGRWGGLAADWGPMRDARKVNAMATWTSQQNYCQAG